jgi:hypothetical protein
LFYYVHLLHVSNQLDHDQAIFHEMYYSLLNCISKYFSCCSMLVIINMNVIKIPVFRYVLVISLKI